jgi:hypothetical protein
MVNTCAAGFHYFGSSNSNRRSELQAKLQAHRCLKFWMALINKKQAKKGFSPEMKAVS